MVERNTFLEVPSAMPEPLFRHATAPPVSSSSATAPPATYPDKVQEQVSCDRAGTGTTEATSAAEDEFFDCEENEDEDDPPSDQAPPLKDFPPSPQAWPSRPDVLEGLEADVELQPLCIQRNVTFDWFESPSPLTGVPAATPAPAPDPGPPVVIAAVGGSPNLPTVGLTLPPPPPFNPAPATLDANAPSPTSPPPQAPPPPPFEAAPEMQEPELPRAPSAPPLPAYSAEAPSGEAADKVTDSQLEVMQPTLTRRLSDSGCTHVHWTVDAKRLETKDKQAVSPVFTIDFPECGKQTFKLVLYPTVVNDNKRGAGFKKAKGRGRVVLKCESELPETVPKLVFRISIGKGDKRQAPRGPVANNFAEHSCCGLPKCQEEWHFSTAVDEATRTGNSEWLHGICDHITLCSGCILSFTKPHLP